jgi:hypothetical protein
MERFRYDRSSKWLIEHHGHLILYLGQVRDVEEWRPQPDEVVQPRKLPDGLLEVRRKDETGFHPYILEIETYAERSAAEDLLDDLMLVYQDRRELADVLIVVLRPKGEVRVADSIALRSRAGLTRLDAGWRVVELWTLRAADLLATGEPGLMPWVPLTQIEGPPEVVLHQCRRVIDEKAKAEEHDNLLAVTQVLMGLNYSDPRLFAIFGGKEAMIESPVLENLLAEQRAAAVQRVIGSLLKERFGVVPPDVEVALQKVTDPLRLEALNKLAAFCPDLEAFRQQLGS